jgi:hypothetical protein
MTAALAVWWILVGWCGTPPRPWPWPPGPPDPNPWIVKILGAIGGLVGGWVFNSVWAIEGSASGIDVAATAAGAWVGAVIIANIYGLIAGGRKA